MKKICAFLLAFGHLLFAVSCASSPPSAVEPAADINDQERRLMRLQYQAQAGLYLQQHVLATSPELHFELQQIVDRIAAANGSELEYRVYLVHDSWFLIHSFPTGEIIVPTGCLLDLVENKHELAFCLAREIAYHDKDLLLAHNKAITMDRTRANQMMTIGSFLFSFAVEALWAQYVSGPLTDRITDEIMPVPPSQMAPDWAGRSEEGRRLYSASQFPRVLLRRDLRLLVNNHLVGNAMGWIPRMITRDTLEAADDILVRMVMDLDKDFRDEKDRLGVVYMQNAGYDSEASPIVIKRWDDLLEQVAKRQQAAEEESQGGDGAEQQP